MDIIPEEISKDDYKKSFREWRQQNDGNFDENEEKDPSDADSYESDWEREIGNNGQVFYVNPIDVLNTNSKVKLKEEEEKAENNEGRSGKNEKTSRNGKLSRLVRRRESKRERIRATSSSTSGLTHSNMYNNAHHESDGDSSSTSYGQIKTFESFFEGASSPVQLTDVILRIKKGHPIKKLHKGGSPNQSIDNNLIEKVLGIIPIMSESGDRISVAGYITDGPAIKASNQIKIGDWVRSIDGQHVNRDNIDSVLSMKSQSSNKIKITVQRPLENKGIEDDDDDDDDVDHHPLPPPPSHLPPLSNISTTYSKIFQNTGDDSCCRADISQMLNKYTFLVLYLTRRGISESSPEMADVVFQYPPSINGDDEQLQKPKLLKVRGIFSTLCTAIPEMSGGSKPLVTSVSLDGELIHVGYAEEREDVLLMGLPASRCSTKDVSQIIRDTVRVLRFKYQTLYNAFSHKNNFSSELNKFFSVLILDELMSIGNKDAINYLGTKFDEHLPAAQWLHLPEDIKFQIDDALTQFEASDFMDYAEGFYDLPREFNILGSCLFHKSFIIASHLPRDDMVDIYLTLHYNKLLQLTSETPVNQIVIWTEVFPTRKSSLQQLSSTSSNYTEPEGSRTFLLIVGLGHQLYGVLLETGGCTAKPKGNVRPDPFYVDQAVNTLDHLVDMGIPLVCDRWSTLPPNPDIIDVDHLYSASSNEGTQQKGGVVLKRTKSVEYYNHSETTSESDTKSESSREAEQSTAFRGGGGSNDDSQQEDDESSIWELYRSGQQRHKVNYSGSGNKDRNIDDNDDDHEVVTYQVSQLSISPQNTIFHYVHLDVGEGVFLSPLSTPKGPLHQELLGNIKAACSIIHSTFQMTLNNRETLRTAAAAGASSSSSSSKAWLNRSLVAVKEQGMMFQWSPINPRGKRIQPPLSYWVTGRLFLSPNPRECYVCYHDSSPQLMIELAFRLAHGVHL